MVWCFFNKTSPLHDLVSTFNYQFSWWGFKGLIKASRTHKETLQARSWLLVTKALNKTRREIRSKQPFMNLYLLKLYHYEAEKFIFLVSFLIENTLRFEICKSITQVLWEYIFLAHTPTKGYFLIFWCTNVFLDDLLLIVFEISSQLLYTYTYDVLLK